MAPDAQRTEPATMEERLGGFWQRAHRVLVHVSSGSDDQQQQQQGGDCGGVEAQQVPPGQAPRPAAHQGPPGAYTGGCPVLPAGGAGARTQRAAPSAPPPRAPPTTSTSSRVSDSGEQLHPLTNMPMALYQDQEGSPAPLPQPSSAPASASSTSSSWWWPRRRSGLPSPSRDAPATPGAQPSAQGPTAAATPGLGTQRQRSSIPMASPAATSPSGSTSSTASGGVAAAGGACAAAGGPGAAAASGPAQQPSSLPHHQQGVVHPEGAHPVWMYPSEDMFFRAMQRKGWQPDARDMSTVVAIHNAVNERAWQEVCAWEALHRAECPQGPRLARFQGRPADLSPKARFLNMLGYAPPFDRHDWVVDRCGKQVRYVIDFYAGVPVPGGPPAAMWLDTRPALDSFEALWDRAVMTARWLVAGVVWTQGPGGPGAARHAASAGPPRGLAAAGAGGEAACAPCEQAAAAAKRA